MKSSNEKLLHSIESLSFDLSSDNVVLNSGEPIHAVTLFESKNIEFEFKVTLSSTKFNLAATIVFYDWEKYNKLSLILDEKCLI